jgi:hypothetical protein
VNGVGQESADPDQGQAGQIFQVQQAWVCAAPLLAAQVTSVKETRQPASCHNAKAERLMKTLTVEAVYLMEALSR